jgi:hypothetical protein
MLIVTNTKMEEYRKEQLANNNSTTDNLTQIIKLLGDAALAIRRMAQNN